MKRTYKYTFDCPIWSESENKSLGYVRTTAHIYLRYEGNDLTYTPGDWDIDSMELIDCDLATYVLNEYSGTDHPTMIKAGHIIDAIAWDYCHTVNDQLRHDLQAQEANEADYPTLNRQFIHP